MKDYFSDLKIINLEKNNDKIQNELKNKLSSEETMPFLATIDILKESIRCYADCEKVIEHEHTERKRIIATLKSLKYQIDANKEICLKEIDKYYEDRKMFFTSIEKVIDYAIKIGDKEMLMNASECLLTLYNSSSNNKRLSLGNSMMNKLK